ncbi:MAG: phenylalanine--tRNA ligase subunit beta, partial [Chloroflexi bacterium]|nr:phenylalanine--tRNA ligase subunit beta [Chloroflexota bacterium]
GERATVVCGAPNVASGQRVAFARPGARLHDPDTGRLETLKAARIRGVESAGMVCSERELGLGEDHTGILVLDGDAPVGTPLADHLGDVVLDTEPTTNRPDWLSVLGVAHEVAALTGGSVREPELAYPEEGPPIEEQVTIRVEAPDLSPRYTASLITGVRIGASPRWLRERLLRAGQRPINNIVDVTNYVMLEYGQPLHAFDYNLLEESGEGKGRDRKKTVVVRRARAGETLVTLDGESRKLSPEALVIADAKRAIGLAGVMGGANTEMTESTTAVLVESAKFDAVNIRRTASTLKLRSEASTRFERNLNGDLASIALRRATRLIQELAGGRVARGIIDLDARGEHQVVLPLSLDRVERVLGVRFSLKEARGILVSLGFGCQRLDSKTIIVTAPYWRSDIAIEDDLVEELARIHGYDNIPTTPLSQGIPLHQPQPMRALRERMKDLLAAAGMQETISYSLTSYETLRAVDAVDRGVEPLEVSNPMTAEHQHLRTSLLGNVLNTLATNLHHEESGVGLFEVGRVYVPRRDDLPHEREMAVGLLWGERSPLSWSEAKENVDFYDAKGAVEAVLEALGKHPQFQPGSTAVLHPGRTAEVLVDGERVGVVGEVHPDVLERFDIPREGATALFEIDLDALLPLLAEQALQFAPLARFPGAYRDLALVLDADVAADRLKEIIEGNSLVESATVFDVYAGPGVAEGKRSLAFRVHFQSEKGTLTAETVNKAQERILRDLEQKTGARLRG